VRPLEVLNQYSKKYPGAWKQYDVFRNAKGELDFIDWPDWCFVPVAASYAIVSQGHDIVPRDLVPDIGIIHALSAWRITKGIYRFDERIYQKIVETPLDRDIPCEHLFRLPEWCVYVETFNDPEMFYGFWASLEYDVNEKRNELRLVIDTGPGGHVFPLPIHLLPGKNLYDSLESVFEYSSHMAMLMGENVDKAKKYHQDALKQMLQNIDVFKKFLNLLLYLCAARPDIYDESDPANFPHRAQPKKTKKGLRYFPASKPVIWETGVRTSEFLSQASSRSDNATQKSIGDSRSPSPHIRKAHWHSFWTGPRNGIESDRKLEMKWLPPLPVGFSMEELEQKLIPTIHKVKK
jgi:hypothetical protein